MWMRSPWAKTGTCKVCLTGSLCDPQTKDGYFYIIKCQEDFKEEYFIVKMVRVADFRICGSGGGCRGQISEYHTWPDPRQAAAELPACDHSYMAHVAGKASSGRSGLS